MNIIVCFLSYWDYFMNTIKTLFNFFNHLTQVFAGNMYLVIANGDTVSFTFLLMKYLQRLKMSALLMFPQLISIFFYIFFA